MFTYNYTIIHYSILCNNLLEDVSKCHTVVCGACDENLEISFGEIRARLKN